VIRFGGTAVLVAAVFFSSFVAGGAARSQDTAEPAPLAARALLLDVAALGDGHVSVGDRGHLLIGGDRVRQVLLPTRRLMTTVAVSGETVLVGGHDAQILRSTDGGESWEVVYRDPEWGAPILSLLWRDGETAIASGGFGLYLVSEDAGATWAVHDVDPDAPHFYDLEPHGAEGVTIVGEFGTVWRADTPTGPWRRLDVPYGGSLFGGHLLDDARLLVFGLEGNLLIETADEVFAPLPSPTDAAMLDAVDLGDGRVLLAGRAGRVLLFDPRDGMLTLMPRGDREDIAGLAVAAGGVVLAVGERGIGRLDPVGFVFEPIELAPGAVGGGGS